MKKLNEPHSIDQSTLQELNDFSKAAQLNAEKARLMHQTSIKNALLAVKADIDKWIKAYKDKAMSFDEAYEEITYLHVFSTIYLDPEKLESLS